LTKKRFCCIFDTNTPGLGVGEPEKFKAKANGNIFENCFTKQKDTQQVPKIVMVSLDPKLTQPIPPSVLGC